MVCHLAQTTKECRMPKLLACSAVLILTLMAGCSSNSPAYTGGRAYGAGTAASGACQWNPGSCMHEGQYEPGERDYAEYQARMLNEAELRRLRGR